MAKPRKIAEAEGEADAEAGPETPWTSSIPAAGKKYYGLGKFASYAVADDVTDNPATSEHGPIPYIRIGRLKRALTRKIEAKLAGSNNSVE
jgi:hypothetical protein